MKKKTFWEEMNGDYKCEGNFSEMHKRLESMAREALKDRTKTEHVTAEAEAIIESLGVKDTAGFWVCSFDDWERRNRKLHRETFSRPEYYFFWWWTGNLAWRFPGGYEGSVWIH